MEVLSRILLACLLFAGSSVAAQKNMYMHRSGATSGDSAGWYYGKSTRGHFAVRIPIPFNDFTMYLGDTISKPSLVYMLGGSTSDGCKFQVMEAAYQKPRSEVDLIKLATASGEGDHLKIISKLPYAGYEAVFFHVSNSKSAIYTRIVKGKKHIYMVSLEYPLTLKKDIDRIYLTFFNSLKLQKLS